MCLNTLFKDMDAPTLASKVLVKEVEALQEEIDFQKKLHKEVRPCFSVSTLSLLFYETKYLTTEKCNDRAGDPRAEGSVAGEKGHCPVRRGQV